ncbi:MAG: tetratricopeptide repeat protein [Porphyromonadaceae bacterium]|nr:tetratricopeptide repeat protein [Porphyromonadaceae bacterium]
MYRSSIFVILVVLGLGLQNSIALGQTKSVLKVAPPKRLSSSKDSISSEHKIKANEYFYRGTLEASQERHNEAFALLRHSHTLWPTNPEISHALGKAYGQRGNYNETIRLLRAAYEGDKAEQTYMLALASAYLWGNNNEEAQSILEEWLHRNPTDEVVIQQLGKLYFRSGAYDKALRLYDQLLASESQYHRYIQIVGIKVALLEARGQKKKATETWQALLSKFADREEAVLAYTDWCLRSEQIVEGQQALTKLADRTTSSSVREMQIRYALAQKDYQSAEQILISLIDTPEAEVDNLLVLWYQFLIEQRTEDKLPESYNDIFERIIKLHPEHTNAYLTYGQVLRLQQRYAEAIETIRPLARTEPENEEVWNSLIGDAISLGDEALVTELCLEAIKYIQTDWRYYFYGSVGLYSEDKRAEARELVSSALNKLPEMDKEGRGHLLGHLGDLASEAGDTLSAFRHYEEALELYPDNPTVLNNYAYALAERGEQLDKAERMAAQGVKLQGDNANLLDTYAWIFYKRGKYSLAQLYQRKAIDTNKDAPSGVMYDHLGDIMAAMNDTEAALSAWQRAEGLYLEELKESRRGDREKKTETRLSELRKKIKKNSKK